MTPNDSARLSPMDRVKAVPGYSWSWAQIRGGSPPSLYGSDYDEEESDY